MELDLSEVVPQEVQQTFADELAQRAARRAARAKADSIAAQKEAARDRAALAASMGPSAAELQVSHSQHSSKDAAPCDVLTTLLCLRRAKDDMRPEHGNIQLFFLNDNCETGTSLRRSEGVHGRGWSFQVATRHQSVFLCPSHHRHRRCKVSFAVAVARQRKSKAGTAETQIAAYGLRHVG